LGGWKPRLHKRCPDGARTVEDNVILPPILQPAEAGFVCVDAVSNRRLHLVQQARTTSPKTPNHDKINPDIIHNSPQWKKTAPKPT
jgi:hypothetical protein